MLAPFVLVGRRAVVPPVALALALVLVVFVVVGCSAVAAPTGSPSDPTAPPSGAPSPTSAEPSAAPSSAAPPAAWLVLPDGNRVAGALGSWTLDGAGSDAPWLPASALETVSVAPGTTLEVALDGGLRIGTWRADVAMASDPTGADAGPLAGREADAPALERIELPPLEAGSWVVRVTTWFADGRGDAAYSWAIEVPGG